MQRSALMAAVDADVSAKDSRTSVTIASPEILPGFLASLGQARKAASRSVSVNNLKQIGLAIYNYHDVHNAYPQSAGAEPGGPPVSWRVRILPHLGYESLYIRYDQSQPGDSPANRKLLFEMPPVYRVPGDQREEPYTGYFAMIGPELSFREGTLVRIRDVRRGVSNTAMVVEAKRPVPWTKPEDLTFEPGQPLPEIGGFFDGGANVALGDMSVRFLTGDVLKFLVSEAPQPDKVREAR